MDKQECSTEKGGVNPPGLGSGGQQWRWGNRQFLGKSKTCSGWLEVIVGPEKMGMNNNDEGRSLGRDIIIQELL